MQLHSTSGYHLEGNGQMEWANQVMEQYPQVYTNYQQDDWAELLPLAKFAYNNATNTTMRVSPFFANKGYHPELTMDLQVTTMSMEAERFVANLSGLQEELKENIARAQERYQRNADHNRAEVLNLKLGNWVYIKAKYFRTGHPSKKLLEKNLGPFDTPGTHSFTI